MAKQKWSERDPPIEAAPGSVPPGGQSSVQEVLTLIALRVREGHEEGDPEKAHKAEDELHVAALRAIAAGHGEPRVLAALALSTARLGFRRWYG